MHSSEGRNVIRPEKGAIAINPDIAEAYSHRGVALQELNQLNAAVTSYDKAIAIKPDYAEAYYNRGVALQALKQLEAAVASYDEAIKGSVDYLAKERGGRSHLAKFADSWLPNGGNT